MVLSGVFSPGNPVAFHQSYLAGQSLLDQLEGLAGSRAAVERLRSSTAAAGWAKRWNLAVYFSLVYQDIAGGWVREGPQGGRGLQTPPQRPSFMHHASCETVDESSWLAG